MGILDNLEAYIELEPDNLATKVFIEDICKDCKEVDEDVD